MNPHAYNPKPETKKMSEQTEQTPAPEAENAQTKTTEEKPAETTTTTSEGDANVQNKTPMKKVKSKKDLKNDPNRFEMPGVNFNAKLIGIDDVESARGDKMCQESMHKLKIAVKTSGQHKQKIVINVSLDGIRIIDLRTQTTHHSHAVHRISFISRDLTDGRAFGYVFGTGDGKHKFFAIKTEKAAEALVLTLRDLFQVVYDLKKKEMEEAKNKVEEKAEEAKEEEPVYQVPNKAVPVENGGTPAEGKEDPTYQVPPNNAPVKDTSNDLLMLETEMEAIEKRIEEINTMDELFKELEAPPVTAAPPASSSSSWSSDLAGLSGPTQPTFSIGGGPFPGGQQQFMQQPGFPPQQPQPGMMNQPFGAPAQPVNPMMANAPFGNQPPQPNPFQGTPGVPPRAGMGFPISQPGPGFPGTPFPGFQGQQPGFPAVPQRGGPSPQPVINVQAPTDPFGNDPFQTGEATFDDGILTPAKLETQGPEKPEQPKKKDAFEDLVSIGGKTEPNKSPKDLFVDLSTPAKTSLNELKVGNRTPSPKLVSPFGNQASPESQSSPISNVSWTNNPFSSNDPFTNDPFASHTNVTIASSLDNVQTALQNKSTAQPSVGGSVLKGDIFGDDDFNLPSPDGPPPPLPDGIINQSVNIESHIRPEPPPRPNINTRQTPPLPPRPGSALSDSAKNRSNSMNESQTINQQNTPPLPPRPRPKGNTFAVPRPRPRSSNQKDSLLNKSESVNSESRTRSQEKVNSPVRKAMFDHNANNAVLNSKRELTKPMKIKTELSKNSGKTSISSPKIADPFVSTDPFAAEDPFSSTDPFSSDPFASDPFSDPVFTSNTQPSSSNDPFTSVVSSPTPTKEDSDPFSVFDKTFSSDSFKFDKSSMKKVKLKGAAQ